MKYEIVIDVNQENENESTRKITISSRTLDQVKGLLMLADALQDGKQLPDPAEFPQEEPKEPKAPLSEEYLARMMKTFDNAYEFTQKKGGLDISSSVIVALNEIRPKLEGVLYAYGYGFRKGYNKAAKEEKEGH